MIKQLQIFVTTSVVGVGVWWGVLLVSTGHGLVAEAAPVVFNALSWVAIASGILAALLWAWRRAHNLVISTVERVLFSLALLSLLYLICLLALGM